MRWLLALLGMAAAAVLVVLGDVLPIPATRLVADLTGFVGAVVAAAAFGVTAWRCPQSPGRWPMALGLAGWGAGQGIWTWHRAIDNRSMTFPDVENILYLALPVCVGAALLIAAHAHGHDRSPDLPTRVLLLDALLLAIGVVGLTWETTIGAAAAHAGTSGGELLLATIYTISDLILIMLALVLALGLRRMWRRPLAWLIGGMLAIGVSDAIYAYAISANLTTPPAADVGYMAGPWFLLLSALVSDRPFRRRETVSLLMLPYLPLGAALALTLLRAAMSPQGPSAVEIYVLVALLCLVVLRQLISQRRLAAAHRTLTHLARTDPLTQVANRSGLQAFVGRASEDQVDEIGILLIDLNGFKTINDQHGHATGDAVLRVVADRLRHCVRTSDLAARLGGDEFVAVLCPAPAEPDVLIGRISAVIAASMLIDGRSHWVGASIGYSTIEAGGDLSTALAAADDRMYVAKSSQR